jgi:hypothetical protein
MRKSMSLPASRRVRPQGRARRPCRAAISHARQAASSVGQASWRNAMQAKRCHARLLCQARRPWEAGFVSGRAARTERGNVRQARRWASICRGQVICCQRSGSRAGRGGFSSRLATPVFGCLHCRFWGACIAASGLLWALCRSACLALLFSGLLFTFTRGLLIVNQE